MKQKTHILGQDYEIIITSDFEKYPNLENSGGYTDYTIKEIVIRDYSKKENQPNECENQLYIQNRVLRHEIIHAYAYESGLWCNSEWASNEEMTDWIAIQFNKMKKTFNELEGVK